MELSVPYLTGVTLQPTATPKPQMSGWSLSVPYLTGVTLQLTLDVDNILLTAGTPGSLKEFNPKARIGQGRIAIGITAVKRR
jgi:hypothetical protein